MMYLLDFAEVMDQSYERILKKEAHHFIDNIFETMFITSRGDVFSMFASDTNFLTGKKLKNHGRNTHFEFRHEHCHAIFNEAISYDNNILLLLRHEFKLSKEEIQEILRKAVKRLLKENNIEIKRKVKVFSGPLKH